jgi:hypothetical protein
VGWFCNDYLTKNNLGEINNKNRKNGTIMTAELLVSNMDEAVKLFE